MKNIIDGIANMFSDVSLTRSGMNMMILLAVVWVVVLIARFLSSGELGDPLSITTITGSITGFMTTLGVAKHHKEKNV